MPKQAGLPVAKLWSARMHNNVLISTITIIVLNIAPIGCEIY